VNEFGKIFNKMGIDTQDVLEAVGTKWNFLPFKPGLVGGHCIGVDPYYLAAVWLQSRDHSCRQAYERWDGRVCCRPGGEAGAQERNPRIVFEGASFGHYVLG